MMESHEWIIFHEFCLGKSWKPIEIFYFNQIEKGIETFSNKNCKVTFGFEYICGQYSQQAVQIRICSPTCILLTFPLLVAYKIINTPHLLWMISVEQMRVFGDNLGIILLISS